MSSVVKNKLISVIENAKHSFEEDKIGFALELLCYIFIFLTFVSLPLFTYRDDYTIITNTLCIASSILSITYVLLRGKFYLNHSILFILLFLLYAFIITPLTTKSIGYERLFSTFLLFAFVLCLTQFWFNKNKIGFLVFCICFSIIVFLAFFVFKYRKDILSLNFNDRFGYDFGNVNTICFIFDVGALFLIYVSFTRMKWYLLLLPFAALMVFCALITGSRWGFVSLFFGVAFMAYQIVGKRYKLIYFLILVIIVCVAIGLLQLKVFAQYKKHFDDLFKFLTDPTKRGGSSSIRANMILDGLKLWTKNIFFGYGTNGFYANTSYGYFSHSTVIELLTNYGIIGFLLFYIPFFKIFFKSAYLKSPYAALLRSFCFFLIFYSLFANVHISKLGMIVWSGFIGLDFVSNKEKQYYLSASFFDNKKFLFSFNFVQPEKTSVKCAKKENIRIAFVISSLSRGGAERVASILASKWAEKGHDVSFFLTSKDTEHHYEVHEKVKINYICKKNSGFVLPAIKINRLTDSLSQYNPDIIVSFLGMPTYYASCAAQRLGVPFICSERNDPAKVKNLLIKFLRHLSYSRSDAIVFQGKQAQNYFGKSIREKSCIIYNPCSLKTKSKKRKNKTIIAVGRLVDDKGFDVLIDAFVKSKICLSGYSLEIYGNGPNRQKLIDKVEQLNATGNVSIYPFDNEIHEKMSRSELFVLSSRHEGMPNVLCEAMLMGLPCVATDCPIGLSGELIKIGINGQICQTDNVDSLASSINEVLLKISDYEKGAKENITYYETIFNPNEISDKWINLMNDTIDYYNENK